MTRRASRLLLLYKERWCIWIQLCILQPSLPRIQIRVSLISVICIWAISLLAATGEVSWTIIFCLRRSFVRINIFLINGDIFSFGLLLFFLGIVVGGSVHSTWVLADILIDGLLYCQLIKSATRIIFYLFDSLSVEILSLLILILQLVYFWEFNVELLIILAELPPVLLVDLLSFMPSHFVVDAMDLVELFNFFLVCLIRFLFG